MKSESFVRQHSLFFVFLILFFVVGFAPRIPIREGINRVIQNAEIKIKENKELAEKQMYFETLKNNK